MLNITTLAPLLNRVLVEVVFYAEREINGVIIPASTENRETELMEGIVVKVGPGFYQSGIFVPTSIKPGTTIFFNKFVGHEIKENGVVYVIMNEPDIVACVESE